MLPGQPELSDQPEGCAEVLPAAASVHRARGRAGVRRQQCRQAGSAGRADLPGRGGGCLLRMADRI